MKPPKRILNLNIIATQGGFQIFVLQDNMPYYGAVQWNGESELASKSEVLSAVEALLAGTAMEIYVAPKH